MHRTDGSQKVSDRFSTEYDDDKQGVDGDMQRSPGSERQGRAPVKPLPNATAKGCDWKNVAKWVAVAFAVAALVPGFAGLLVYFGRTPNFLSFLGQLSKSTGMWMAIGGLGTTAIGTMVSGTLSCFQRKERVEADQITRDGDKPTWKTCWFNCKRTAVASS